MVANRNSGTSTIHPATAGAEAAAAETAPEGPNQKQTGGEKENTSLFSEEL